MTAPAYYRSETSFFRDEALPFCQGNGLDVGYGGDPILPTAITIDFAKDGQFCGDHPCNILGDATKLSWFADDAFDYVYSSHCLEDFLETRAIVKEWLRIVKPGGYLVLLLPDQRKYERYCRDNNLKTNPGHRIAEFGPDYLRGVMKTIQASGIIRVKKNLGPYNFLFVVQKRERLKERVLERLRQVPLLRKIKDAVWPGHRRGPGSRAETP